MGQPNPQPVNGIFDQVQQFPQQQPQNFLGQAQAFQQQPQPQGLVGGPLQQLQNAFGPAAQGPRGVAPQLQQLQNMFGQAAQSPQQAQGPQGLASLFQLMQRGPGGQLR